MRYINTKLNVLKETSFLTWPIPSQVLCIPGHPFCDFVANKPTPAVERDHPGCRAVRTSTDKPTPLTVRVNVSLWLRLLKNYFPARLAQQ
jgi:hypothetical protein